METQKNSDSFKKVSDTEYVTTIYEMFKAKPSSPNASKIKYRIYWPYSSSWKGLNVWTAGDVYKVVADFTSYPNEQSSVGTPSGKFKKSSVDTYCYWETEIENIPETINWYDDGAKTSHSYNSSLYQVDSDGVLSVTFSSKASAPKSGGPSGGGGNEDQDDAVIIYGDYNIAYSGTKENVHYWDSSNNNKSTWPGVPMDEEIGTDGKTYRVAKVASWTANILFNTGGDDNKTGNFSYDGNYIYNDSGKTNVKVVFKPESERPTVEIYGDYNLVYKGDKANVYYWGEGVSSPAWPGVAMATVTGSDGKKYKAYKLPAGVTGMNFNTNGDDNKTGDLAYSDSKFFYDDNGKTDIPVIIKPSRARKKTVRTSAPARKPTASPARKR